MSPKKPEPFDGMKFVAKTYTTMVAKGADGHQAMEVAVNLLLNVLLGVVTENPEACRGGVQAVAAGLREGFQKLENATDALRCREVLEYYPNFKMRPKA